MIYIKKPLVAILAIINLSVTLPFHQVWAQEAVVDQPASVAQTSAETLPVTPTDTGDISASAAPDTGAAVLSDGAIVPVANETPAPVGSSVTTPPATEEPIDPAPSSADSLGGGDLTKPQVLDATIEKRLPKTDEVTGALVYNYPFDVPIGRNGMNPDLSLQYNSQSKENSIFGSGWSDNLPSIERINKKGSEIIYTGNYYTSSLDGELVQTATSTYRAKVEGGAFNSYVFQNNAWIVTSKDGKAYTFGYSTSTRQDNIADGDEVYKWMVEKVSDTNGNYINYGYYKDAGQIYPDTISYTNNANASSTGIYAIQFSREQRPDNQQHYLSKFLVKNNYRINEITASVNGSWVKKYDFVYASNSTGNTSVIQSIAEKGKDENGNEITLPATEFTYQASANKGITVSSSWQLPSGVAFIDSNTLDEGTRIVDINGDSLPDIVRSYQIWATDPSRPVPVNHFYTNTGTGWVEDSNWRMPPNGGVNQYGDQPTFTFNDIDGHDTGLRIADLNGDGLADLYMLNILNQTRTKYVWINKGDRTGWYDDTANWNLPDVAFWSTGDLANADGAQMVDLNGDNLPDILRAKHNSDGTVSSGVYVNDGSRFVQSTTTWQLPSGVAFIDSNTLDEGTRIVDINGDSLPDIVRSYQIWATDPSRPVPVNHFYTNTGTGWVEDSNWRMPPNGGVNQYGDQPTFTFNDIDGHDTGLRIADLNGDGLADLYMLNIWSYNQTRTKHAWINKGDGTGWYDDTANWNLPDVAFWETGYLFNQDGAQMVDLNGDNLPDILRAVHNPNGTFSSGAYVNDGKEELLSSITIPGGGKVSISYKNTSAYMESGSLTNPKLPFSLVTVATITNNDGFGNYGTTTYSYYDGLYYFADVLDRKFAGFGKITKTDEAGNVTKTYYHQGNTSDPSNGEYDDDISKMNKPYRVEKYDNESNLYSLIVNKWDKYNVTASSTFVKLVQTTEEDFDGNGTHKDKAEAYAYNDNTGNLLQKITWGEVSGGNDGSFTDAGTDKATHDYSYAASSTNSVLSLPSRELVTDQPSNTVKDTKWYYDGLLFGSFSKGNSTREEKLISGSTYASTTKAYNNNYGIVTQEADARGNATNYSYDSYNLFVATSTNPLGQMRNFLYDYSSGKVATTTDENGRVFAMAYDALDRVVAEKQPDQTTPSTLVTKSSYIYTDTSLAVAVQKTSYLDASLTNTAYAYKDGFGRITQTRTQAEGADTYAVSDAAFNNRGLVQKEALPYFSSGSARTSATTDNSLYFSYAYDPLNRVTQISNAVGDTTNTYDDWKVTTTDPRGKQKILAKDAHGNLAKVEEKNNGDTYTTSYEYNLLGNLTKMTDAEANVRNFTYDNLERRLFAEDLHASGDSIFGSWSYTYDDAGNRTQSIDPKNQTINYTFDLLSRNTTEDYTGQSGTEIVYTYDNCANGKTRICMASSTDVLIYFAYNPLGGMATEVKTIVGGVTSTTTYEYDRQGNQTLLTNPDSSKVKSIYNSAGLLDKVQRKESTYGSFVDVVSNFDYGPHGKATTQTNANGTVTTNTYDAEHLYRLARKQTSGQGGSVVTSTTTLAFYSAVGDGSILYNTSSDWNTARTATTGTAVNYIGTTRNVNTGKYTSTNYNIERAFIPFDTSAIPDSAITTSAKLKVYVNSKLNNDNDGTDFVSVVQATESSITYLATGDYDLAGSINNPVEGISTGERKDITSVITGSYLVFNMNATGTAWISKTGPTKLALREGHDITNSAFVGASGQYNQLTFRNSEYSGTSTDPVLEVTYTEHAPMLTVIQDISYAYDADNNITNITDHSDTGVAKIVAYTYDDLNRLLTASTTAASSTPYFYTYTYSPIGNMLFSTPSGNCTYSGMGRANPHTATQIGALSQAYDNNGNFVSDQVSVRTWNYKNQLIYSLGDNKTSTYAYDHNGDRVMMTESWATTTYPTKYYNTDGAIPTKHIFAGDLLIATIKGTGSTTTTTYLHTDHLGGTSAVTNGSGALIQTIDYYPYGSTRVSWSFVGHDEQRGYAGTERDNFTVSDFTNLNYMMARYQRPWHGRFISQDPMFWKFDQAWLADPQNQNSYAYARNNPVTNSDPAGNLTFSEATRAINSWLIGLFGSKQGYAASPEQLMHGNKARDINLGSGSWVSQYSLPNPSTACFGACERMAGYAPSGSINMATYDGNNNLKLLSGNTGVDAINKYLSDGQKVIVGVNKGDGGRQNGNLNPASNHFIVINGRYTDNNTTYYTFLEPGTRYPEKGESPNNRLYLSSNGSLTGKTAYTASDGSSINYTATEVKLK